MAGQQFSKPALQLLTTLEIPSLVEWERLGYLLGLPSCVVEAIEADYHTTTHCTLRVFSEWFKRIPDASWSKVAECLCNIGRHTLAQGDTLAPADLTNQGDTLAGKVSLYVSLLVIWFTAVIAFRSQQSR